MIESQIRQLYFANSMIAAHVHEGYTDGAVYIYTRPRGAAAASTLCCRASLVAGSSRSCRAGGGGAGGRHAACAYNYKHGRGHMHVLQCARVAPHGGEDARPVRLQPRRRQAKGAPVLPGGREGTSRSARRRLPAPSRAPRGRHPTGRRSECGAWWVLNIVNAELSMVGGLGNYRAVRRGRWPGCRAVLATPCCAYLA